MTEAEARRLVTERAAGRCELCHRPANNFAHRRNRSQGGQWAPSNGLLLCGSGTTGCHGWTTSHPLHAEQGGWRVESWADPIHCPAWLRTIQFGVRWVLLDDDGCLDLDVQGPQIPPEHLPPNYHLTAAA